MATIEIKQNPYYREVPYGGKDGQVLTKVGDTDDFTYQWTDANGTSDYEKLNNKPTLNGVEFNGDITSSEVGLQDTLLDSGEGQNIKTINGESILGNGDLQLDTGKVDDVKVNGYSILREKVANIDLSNYATLDKLQVGFQFRTNVAVGNLQAGTVIQPTDTLGGILYNILYSDVPLTEKIYFGATDNIPSTLTELKAEDVEIETIISGIYEHNIKAGNVELEEGQYPCIALKKKYTLNSWVAKGAESFLLPFGVISLDEYNIYYLIVQSYDEDLGGINYIFNITEAS